MNVDYAYIVFVIIVLLLGTAFTSMAEMAFASLNRARIKHMAGSGNKRATLVLKIHERFDELISAMILCGYGLYIAAATISTFLFLQLMGDIGPFVSAVLLTIIAVVFTDDLPKSMAKHSPERFALLTAPIVWVIMIILGPINFLLVRWKKQINTRFFSKKGEPNGEEANFGGEELLYVVEEFEQEGSITEEESLRISNAIEFHDLLIEDILTPRVNIVGIPKSSSIEEVAQIFLESGYSRLPVYEENIDNVVGVVHIRDFLKWTAGKVKSLDKIMAPVIYTALVSQVTEAFKLLQKEKKHMAIVVDEHGGTEGLVTMDDILRELVGDIWDESDEDTPQFTDLGNNKHKVICTADIDKMYEYFGLEGESESLTVGGWITDILERIPKKGDSFTYNNLTVTVTKANPKRAKECVIEVSKGEDE